MKSTCTIERAARATKRTGIIPMTVFGAVMLAAVSVSQGTQQEELTLEQLVSEALDRNPELQVYAALVDQAKGQRRQAGKWSNPQLEVEGGLKKVEELSGSRSTEHGYEFGAALTQTFEFPGKGSLRKAVANQDTHIAELSLQQFQVSLAGKVRQLALQYRTAVKTAEAAEQIRARSSGLVKLLGDRALGGAKPLLELRVIQASQIEISEMAKEAALARDEAWGELDVLLGRSVRNPVGIAVTVQSLPPMLPALEDILQSSFQNNLLLKIRESEIKRAVLTLDRERLAAAPDFEIGPFFSRERAGDEETTIGGKLSIELPVWNQNQGNIDSARAMQSIANSRLVQAQQELEREVSLRWKTHQAAREQIKNFDPKMLQDLEASSALADRQYRQGAINVQLYLESQRALLHSMQIHNRAVQQLWDTWLDLELLTGGAITIEQTERLLEKEK